MKADDSTPSINSNPSKFYAVQSGRVPGVYTDWPSAQKQITGWTKPKHKSFSTRAEAEAFVKQGPSDGVSISNGLIDRDIDSPAPSSYATGDNPPAAKKAKTSKAPKAKGGAESTPVPQTAEEMRASMTGEPLLAPLPPDAEDGFDRRQIMDYETGKLRWKTEQELGATKMMYKPDNYAATMRVYTDGACRGNGKKGAYAGVGVYFGDGDERYVPHHQPDGLLAHA